jgi:hypothetical protein
MLLVRSCMLKDGARKTCMVRVVMLNFSVRVKIIVYIGLLPKENINHRSVHFATIFIPYKGS